MYFENSLTPGGKSFSAAFKYLLIFTVFIMGACNKSDINKGTNTGPKDTTSTPPPVLANFDINSIEDTYADIAPFQYYTKWSVYNVHDPSIKKFGDYYYCYSTDVAYGISVRPGIQIRKSKDLVQWSFVGWAFNAIPTLDANFIKQNGGTPNDGLWAPYILKVGTEYRLYYALSSSTSRLSVISLATASSPEGPWIERGIVVSSKNNQTQQTNAIDPTVLVTPDQSQWLYYGSAYDGIYVMAIDPATGLAKTNGDIGKRISQRGFTGSSINGNIEAPEIMYNATLKKYFLFISYDWLETKYNVRVGRSDNPDGPFYDYLNADLNLSEDHTPMILAPYQFLGHGGWQGTGHCSVFDNDSGQYFMAHQGRPSVNKYFMDLHVRKIFWTQDGWPVVSPERYAWEDNSLVVKDSLLGKWQQILLNYQVVPGYQNEQISPNLQVAIPLTITSDGHINSDLSSSWSYSAPWLTIHYSDGSSANLMVQKGRDWENKRESLIFTGLNNAGTAVWGKKTY